MSQPGGAPQRASGTPQWAPPAPGAVPPVPAAAPRPGPAARFRRLPTALQVLLVTGLVVLLVVGLVWAAGGFEFRETLRQRQAGETLDLGPVEVTVVEAVAYEYLADQMVEAVGTCRLTHGTTAGSLQYAIEDASLAGVNVSGEVVTSTESSMQFGVTEYTTATVRDNLPPGLAPMDCVIRFTFPGDTPLDRSVGIFLWELEFAEAGNVTNDEDTSRTWQTASDGYFMELPLRHVVR